MQATEVAIRKEDSHVTGPLKEISRNDSLQARAFNSCPLENVETYSRPRGQ